MVCLSKHAPAPNLDVKTSPHMWIQQLFPNCPGWFVGVKFIPFSIQLIWFPNGFIWPTRPYSYFWLRMLVEIWFEYVPAEGRLTWSTSQPTHFAPEDWAFLIISPGSTTPTAHQSAPEEHCLHVLAGHTGAAPGSSAKKRRIERIIPKWWITSMVFPFTLA